MTDYISGSCARQSCRVCRGRVLDPDAKTAKTRWTACGCPCHDDPNQLRTWKSKSDRPANPTDMVHLAK